MTIPIMVILCLSVQKKGMVIIMTKTYYPKGVCSRKYEIDLEDGIIKDIRIFEKRNPRLFLCLENVIVALSVSICQSIYMYVETFADGLSCHRLSS